MGGDRARALATAVAIDVLCGEPPASVHPTVAIGRLLAAGRARRRGTAPATSLVDGAATLLATVASAAGAAGGVDVALRRLPRALRALAGGLVLKPALACRALSDAGGAVERALRDGDLDGARRALAWHLVSRDTTTLRPDEIAGAAIASLAENLTDAFVAPALAYVAAGLPGAYAFRAVNTADAMVGYRTPELEWFGKPAARTDDVLAWLPARVAALAITAAAPLVGGDARLAWRVAVADASRTPSPNGGWPMAAMAGALDVRLEKRDLYILHAGGRAPGWLDLRRARRLLAWAAAVSGAALIVTSACREGRR